MPSSPLYYTRNIKNELKLVLIDPKKVEFSVYSRIANKFMAAVPDEEEPIITDVTKVVRTLNSLCVLMDSRYDLLKRQEPVTSKNTTRSISTTS